MPSMAPVLWRSHRSTTPATDAGQPFAGLPVRDQTLPEITPQMFSMSFNNMDAPKSNWSIPTLRLEETSSIVPSPALDLDDLLFAKNMSFDDYNDRIIGRHEVTFNCTSESGSFNCTQESEESDDAFWFLLLLVFPVLTVFGNVLVILSVFKERSLRSATNYFIVNLAIADLLVAGFVMPLALMENDNEQQQTY
ncbi:G protein-coupled receptor rhodopsin-like [Trinorchestia longiramus]|nr:G protein-coupled receptor rhodopsin-like [Trinorchestia longiramus]